MFMGTKMHPYMFAGAKVLKGTHTRKKVMVKYPGTYDYVSTGSGTHSLGRTSGNIVPFAQARA